MYLPGSLYIYICIYTRIYNVYTCISISIYIYVYVCINPRTFHDLGSNLLQPVMLFSGAHHNYIYIWCRVAVSIAPPPPNGMVPPPTLNPKPQTLNPKP